MHAAYEKQYKFDFDFITSSLYLVLRCTYIYTQI